MMVYLQIIETSEEKTKFEQLYLEYRGLMYHIAYEILHNEQSAEDATHQAFVKLQRTSKKLMHLCVQKHTVTSLLLLSMKP